MNFSRRSYEKEVLDRDDIPFEDIRQNMLELNFINTWLGGHKITISGLQKLVSDQRYSDKKVWSVCEIGCGGGDNLFAISEWGKKKSLNLSLSGIDINDSCIKFATSRAKNPGISFTTSDYRKAVFEEKPDIIFSSLFCHHFSGNELLEMFKWLECNATVGFFINDLHRHPVAYYSIKSLTGLFSKSYLVKNDAPLSVLRGFTRKELEDLSRGCHSVEIEWKWAFRWLLTARLD